MIGHEMPTARQSSTNFLKVEALKNNWVMTKSEPASTFSLSLSWKNRKRTEF